MKILAPHLITVFSEIHFIDDITLGLLHCALSPNVNLTKQDFEVMPGPLEIMLQYDVKDVETRQTVGVTVCEAAEMTHIHTHVLII